MMGYKREEILSMSKTWNVIYPAYLNSTLSESEGPSKHNIFGPILLKKAEKSGKRNVLTTPLLMK